MNLSSPRVLVPLNITDAMLSSSSIAEPAASETVWVSGAAVTIGTERIRTNTHRVYTALTNASGTTPPENDPTNWRDTRPTLKWAPFDTMISTKATATGSLSYVLRPGFFNSVACYGLVGSTLGIVVKDAPGGTVIANKSISLLGNYLDEHDYCWGPFKSRDRSVVTGLTPYPGAELTLTVSAGASAPVGVGIIAIGNMKPMVLGEVGGSEYGMSAEPKSYSYIDTNSFGETYINKRHNGRNFSGEVFVPHESADYMFALLEEILDIPVAATTTLADGYDSFNSFGLLTGRRVASGPKYSKFQLTMKGMI